MKIENNLIAYFKKDINDVLSGISKDHPRLEHSISSAKSDKLKFIMKYGTFNEFVKRYCYKNEINGEYQTSELKKRIELFYETFYSKFNEVRYPILHWQKFLYGFAKDVLYFYLFYAIFLNFISSDKSVESIFSDLYNQWSNAIEKNKMNVNLLIPFPRIILNKDSPLKKSNSFSINKNISLERNVGYEFYEKRGDKHTKTPKFNNYLSINTDLSFDFYPTSKEQNERDIKNRTKFETEWKKEQNLIQELVCSFYVNNLDFKYLEPSVELPWWFGPEDERLAYSDSPYEDQCRFTKEILEKVIEFYPKVINANIFSDEKYRILWHHYMQLYIREFTPDMFLDLFIILEFIFGKGISHEITYRLSLNISFFLAKDLDDFEKIYRFFLKMYGIRSRIVHGEKWIDLRRKAIEEDKKLEELNNDFMELKGYVNQILKKLILLMESYPNIRDEMKGLFFIKNSELIKS